MLAAVNIKRITTVQLTKTLRDKLQAKIGRDVSLVLSIEIARLVKEAYAQGVCDEHDRVRGNPPMPR